jgi:CrcB protein
LGENGSVREIVVVGVGGAVGALARWSLGELIDRPPAGFPWATLLVNLAGCVAIGVASRRWRPGTDRWAFGVTGVLGGFTTFSTFADETRELLAAGRPGAALTVVAVTVAGGLLAVSLARAAVADVHPTA